MGNLLYLAWLLLVWPGRPLVKPVAFDEQIGFVAGMLWSFGLTALSAWAATYLRLGRAVGWTLVSSFVIATTVFATNLGVLMLSDAVMAIRELRGVRFERDNLQSVLAFSESVSLMTKQPILDETVNVVRRLTNADGCLLFLLDPEDDLLKVSA